MCTAPTTADRPERVTLFKVLFIGYQFGIRSEQQLVREIEVKVAYRWFLGLRLTDKVADASTLSQTILKSGASGWCLQLN